MAQTTPAIPTAAFRHRDFRRYQLARLLVILGAEAQSVAVAWQVYELTHRALDLGYTGLALFLPGPLFMLAAGHAADRFDRRNVILVCYVLQTFASGWLFWLGYHHSTHVFGIYAVLFLIGTGRTFSGPASSALLPHLVPKEDFVNAVTWGANVFQTANIAGPALGGVLLTLTVPFGLSGPPLVYLLTMVTLLSFLYLVWSLDVRIGRLEHGRVSLKLILAGFAYVWKARMVLGAITLDLAAVLLGGCTALMPIFAQDILHTGARGLGVLRAAPAVGALIVSIALTWIPIKRHAGHKMFYCVTLFGCSIVLFGFSRSLWLSAFALLLYGGSDMISVVIRSSLIQLATPVEMRGRVSAVNSVFIGASNEFGEFESGATAQWWGAVRAVIIGGMGTLAVTGLAAVLFPSLRKADRLTEEALLQQIEVNSEREPSD
jgi:MFS family permease